MVPKAEPAYRLRLRPLFDQAPPMPRQARLVPDDMKEAQSSSPNGTNDAWLVHFGHGGVATAIGAMNSVPGASAQDGLKYRHIDILI